MIALSIAIIIIGAMATYIADKALDIKKQELNNQSSLNSTTTLHQVTQALTENNQKWNDRFNLLETKHQAVISEMEAVKMAIAIKR